MKYHSAYFEYWKSLAEEANEYFKTFITRVLQEKKSLGKDVKMKKKKNKNKKKKNF